MAKYIKSYSNYVLKTKHQSTNDGTIFERDITTIGGRDQFARGQVPIYKSGNFVITTNNDISNYKKLSDRDWQRNDEGEIWTLNNLKHYEKDEKTSYDRKIVIKKDYYDLRDYAYYGSCSEMMRVSINNILKKFPGELYVPYETLYAGQDGSVQYTEEAAIAAFGVGNYKIVRSGIKGYYTSFENRESRVVTYECSGGTEEHELKTISLLLEEDKLTDQEREELELGIPYTREFKYLTDEFGNLLTDENGNIIGIKSLSLIDNPFGINIHDKFVPDGADPLKYFAEGGIENYVAYLRDSIEDDWSIDTDHEYSITIEDIIFDGLGEKEERDEFFNVLGGNCDIVLPDCDPNLKISVNSHENIRRTINCKLTCIDPGKYIGKIVLCFRKNHYDFRTIPGLQRDDEENPKLVCCDGVLEFENGDDLKDVEAEIEGKYGKDKEDAKIESFKTDDCKKYLTIYMFMGNNNEIKYLVEDLDMGGSIDFEYNSKSGLDCADDYASAIPDFTGTFAYYNFLARIRPKKEIIDDYFDNLDLFEKVLLNRNSDPLYTASFELLSENDFGNYTYLREFTFPTTYGGYNLGSSTQAFEKYVSSLSEIGEYYDSKYTDNLWRSMTHESIKNFDWTYTRHYTPGEEEPYVEGGTKIQKIIRIYGREFDEVKTYIDAIDDLNTVTYDNVNNLPDYFFTDKLEEQGWDVKLVHPLELSEFFNGHMSIPVDIHLMFPNKYDEEGNKICTEDAEKLNYFYDNPIHGEYKEDRTEFFNAGGYICPNDACNANFNISVSATELVEDLTEYYDRNKITIQRVFNQKNVETVPYSCSKITTIKETKYSQTHPDEASSALEFDFNEDNLNPCVINGNNVEMSSTTISGEEVVNGYHNDCGEIIRIYCDENVYTSADVNNEFMKRLLLNSPEIWRHKGTIEGMEMLLSLFGLRSKNRVFTDERYFINQKDLEGGKDSEYFDVSTLSINACGENNTFNIGLTAEKGNCLSLTKEGEKYYKNYKDKLYNLYDYDIKEYTLFTTRQEDEWIPEKNMYKYDWVNSTKLITYNTTASKNGEYITYQGLPISYKEVEEKQSNGTVLKKRYLYPHFNTNGIYDGNPYYQMDGGWMQKKPFAFDVMNNIIPEDYNSKYETLFVSNADGSTTKYESEAKEKFTEGYTIKKEKISNRNTELFTETIKNVKCVQTIQELLSTPSLVNGSGDICQVVDLSGRYAIIDGFVYPLETEYKDNETNKGYSFFYATISNHSLSIGNAFFNDYVIISNPYAAGYKQRIDLLDEYYENRAVKVYILETTFIDEETKEVKTKYDIDVYSKENSISTFTIFENGKYMEGNNYTNYFRINNIDYYNELSVLGWQQLRDDEYEYYRLNTIIDYREGNNPHTGHMRYDNGHKYLTYFQRIFKTVLDDDLIDYRQYEESDTEYIENIQGLGFDNLIDSDVCVNDYDRFLREDSKCHFFGIINSMLDENCNDSRTNLPCLEKREKAASERYDKIDRVCTPKEGSYSLTDIFRKSLIDDSDGKPKVKNLRYGEFYDELGEYAEHYDENSQEYVKGYDTSKIDNVTDQIVNTKRMEIEFFIKNGKEYSKEWLEEVKYIDSVILPYLTQMIPSTVIWRVKYTTRDKEDWCDVVRKPCTVDNFNTNVSSISCKAENTFKISLTAERTE